MYPTLPQLHEQDWERYVALGTLCIASGQDFLGFVGTTAKSMGFQSLWDIPTLYKLQLRLWNVRLK
jgi:hypothetical protein